MKWICGLLFLLFVLPATATVFRSGNEIIIPAGEVINDDLVVAGSKVRIEGTVNGDLAAAGSEVMIIGPVTGTVMLAGSDVTLNGAASGSVYAAGGTVRLRAPIARNATVAGGALTIGNDAVVGRDLTIAGGQVDVAGSVERNLLASAGTLALSDSARIGGNLDAQTDNPQIASGATILGTKTITHGDNQHPERGFLTGWLASVLFLGIPLYVAGVLLLALAPRITAETTDVLRAHPWGSLLAGVIVLAAVIPVFLILLFTLIGIPLAFIWLLLISIATFISPIFTAYLIGELVLRRRGHSVYLALLVGVGLLVVIWLLPVLGGLITLFAGLFGVGALTLALFGRSRHPFFPAAPQEA